MTMLRKIIRFSIITILLLVLLDTGLGVYVYFSARQDCNSHMMYNIPGRGRLTDEPYSTEELDLIRLDCQAYGLTAQQDMLRLPFNQSRIDRRLADVKSECAAVLDYPFRWGCAG